MTILEMFKQMVAFGEYDELTGRDCIQDKEHYVSAGNPGKPTRQYPLLFDIPDTFEMGGRECYKRDFVDFTVIGHSMEPDGIYDGYRILTKRANVEGDAPSGSFIVVGVDEDFYKKKHHGIKPVFDKKLRRSVCRVSSDVNMEYIMGELSDTFAEPFTRDEKADLEESWKTAKKFYGDKELSLSITYHHGRIHYSFHPVDRILYDVVGVMFMKNGKIYSEEIDQLAS